MGIGAFTGSRSPTDRISRKRGDNMAGRSEYQNKWISEKLDRINLTVTKGKKDIIKAHAAGKGESVNSFINRAIDETIARDDQSEGK